MKQKTIKDYYESLKKENPSKFIGGKYFNEIKMKRLFPDLEILHDKKINWNQFVYEMIFEVKAPKCSNPECKNTVEFDNFNDGYRKCCSKKCLGQYQSDSVEFKNLVSKSMVNYHQSSKNV